MKTICTDESAEKRVQDPATAAASLAPSPPPELQEEENEGEEPLHVPWDIRPISPVYIDDGIDPEDTPEVMLEEEEVRAAIPASAMKHCY